MQFVNDLAVVRKPGWERLSNRTELESRSGCVSASVLVYTCELVLLLSCVVEARMGEVLVFNRFAVA